MISDKDRICHEVLVCGGTLDQETLPKQLPSLCLSLTASVRVFEGQLAHQKKLGGLIVVIMHELNNAG